jgi:ATP-dependent helicase HepA
VKASIYTHQLANVLRVLTDVRVRHLLADEVGLGKTVQALMVLNALRYQRPNLRVFVIVPDRLVPQWRDEIMTRAHTAPFGENREEDEGESRQYIRLAWEAQLRLKDIQGNPQLALSDIDPGKFDVLVVDELHHLRSDLQDRIVRVASDFEHVLVLTATPSFQNIKRHAQLFALLEPERTDLLRWQIAMSERGVLEALSSRDDLSKWPEWATAVIIKEFLDRDRSSAEAGDEENLSDIAMAHCAYRRVIRTRRADYLGVLPRRHHHSVVVEPLGAEADRQSLMWQYFEHLGELSIDIDPILLAKRVILSPPSLEQRVDFLRRKGHDRNGLLERVKSLVHQSQGDSRADALVDLLAQIWSRDPLERVLVAAQDNLTVDYLYELVQARLPVIGPIHNRAPLVAARVRQGMMTEAVENLGGFGNETNENLEAFQRGDSQVLFAPEAAQVGLNLQCARVLVLYSVPWKPGEVEQWIGRLDRIGNVAAFTTEDGSKTIDVYTIVQRGLVDEKVVTVLQHFHVFEHSVNLDGEHLEEVAQRIEDAALRPESVNWRELEAETEEMAVEDEIQELESALRPYIPWTVRWATKERERFETLPPAPPLLKELPEHTNTGPRAWDRAFEGMIKLLKRAGEYHVHVNVDPDTGSRFQSLWYQFGEREMGGRKPALAKVIFSFGADPAHERSPRYAHAFITRRGDIQAQPRRSVIMPFERVNVRRPLRFLNFGEALHDELIEGWLPKGDAPLKLNVTYFDDHDLWKYAIPGLYLLRVSVIDPAGTLIEPDVEERALELMACAATSSKAERLPALIQKVKEKMDCALEADVRWLRAQLTAKMRLEVLKLQNGQWTRVEAEEVAALLNPMAHGREGVPWADDLYVSDKIIKAAEVKLARLRVADEAAVKSAWSNRLPEFKRALQARLLVVQEEGRDAVTLARQEVKSAEEGLEVALERGNRPQIVRAENVRDEVDDTYKMVEVLWQQREIWLQDCEHEVLSVQPEEQLICLLNARKT